MFERLIAGLLLVFVIYGTTIEAAHRHGRILKSEQSSSTSVSSHGGTQGVPGSLRSCGECLICQLHQHFSASLITVRLKDSPLTSVAEIFHSSRQSIQTRAVSTQAGRGPPLTN